MMDFSTQKPQKQIILEHLIKNLFLCSSSLNNIQCQYCLYINIENFFLNIVQQIIPPNRKINFTFIFFKFYSI